MSSVHPELLREYFKNVAIQNQVNFGNDATNELNVKFYNEEEYFSRLAYLADALDRYQNPTLHINYTDQDRISLENSIKYSLDHLADFI